MSGCSDKTLAFVFLARSRILWRGVRVEKFVRRPAGQCICFLSFVFFLLTERDGFRYE